MADIIRWDPFRELATLRDEMERLFDTFFGRRSALMEREYTYVPAVDVEETDNEFIVRAELPGMDKKNIKISLSEDAITISGERKRHKEEKSKTYHRIEMAYGKFTRTIEFPCEVDPASAKAVYKNGILTITVPKSEKAKPKEIEIEVK